MKNNPVFQEFQAYWQLSEQLISSATKEEIAEVVRILAIQSAHYARKFGEMEFRFLRFQVLKLRIAVGIAARVVGRDPFELYIPPKLGNIPPVWFKRKVRSLAFAYPGRPDRRRQALVSK